MKKVLGIGLLIALCPTLAVAQQPRFIRLKEEKGQVTALEVAVTHYRNKEGSVSVDLVGVVHIGDRGYYQRLNRLFPHYDAVLYELVATPDTKVPKGGKKEGMLALLGTLMTTVLDLDSQLACVDYDAKNFVHADLSFEAMKEAAGARGDDGLTLGLSITADLLRQQNLAARKQAAAPAPLAGADDDPLALLADPTRLKRELARQLAGGADFGPTLQVLLVADRNKRACQVMTQQIVDGKKNLALFYGAAHMPDFDRRLREEFGLIRQGQDWLTAWDLRAGRNDAARLFRLLEKALDD